MKKILFPFLILLGAIGPATAQTNAPAVKTNSPPTEITSDTADFDLSAHQAVYRGHVQVVNAEVKLACEWMVVDLPSAGAHLSNIVAETNVVIDLTDAKGQTYHVTSAKAVYAYKAEGGATNETVTFTGKPRVETATSTIDSEPMIWDRTRNKFTFIAPTMISRDMGGTNGPAKLF